MEDACCCPGLMGRIAENGPMKLEGTVRRQVGDVFLECWKSLKGAMSDVRQPERGLCVGSLDEPIMSADSPSHPKKLGQLITNGMRQRPHEQPSHAFPRLQMAEHASQIDLSMCCINSNRYFAGFN